MRLSKKKCFKIHVSKSLKSCDRKLKAHGNTVEGVQSASYLGDVINSDCLIDDTIKFRRNKSIGIKNQFSVILNSVSFGFYYAEIAFILREALFVNGILTNSEVWYGIKRKHIATLEAADADIMRMIFGAPKNSH